MKFLSLVLDKFFSTGVLIHVLRIVVAAANLTQASCCLELKDETTAKKLVREVILTSESPEDMLGNFYLPDSIAQIFCVISLTIK